MPRPVKKVIITGDILRPRSARDNWRNVGIHWLHHVVRQPVQLATGLDVTRIDFSRETGSLAMGLYQSMGERIGFDGWAHVYDPDTLPETLLQYCWLHLRHALVIGFELPPVMKRAMDALDIPYLDFILHPIRFADDLFIGAQTSHAGAYERLRAFMLPPDVIPVAAGLVMAAMNRLPRLPLEGKTAIAALQYDRDRVLMHKGRFLSMEDFTGPLEDALRQVDHLIIKPHPNLPDSNDIAVLRSLSPRCSVRNENFYYLMSHENVEAVYSISSSTSIEARALGKAGHHLHTYPFLFVEPDSVGQDVGRFVPMENPFATPEFWLRVLDAFGLNVKPSAWTKLPPKPNRLRISLRSFWGFEFVERITPQR